MTLRPSWAGTDPGKAPWFVYGLIDPRDQTVFYIGCSYQPATRLNQHSSQTGSAAYPRLLELRRLGLGAAIRIFGEYSDRLQAKYIERRMIMELDGLDNREQKQLVFWMDAYEIDSWHEAYAALKKAKEGK